MQEIDKYSRGIVKDRNRLYWEDFKAIPTCYPPFKEQARIADAIEQARHDIEGTVGQIRHEIELLHEYRTRLIADLVTGKLDVREAAARLPEELDEPDLMEDDSEEQDEDKEETDGADMAMTSREATLAD